ncbi:MAG: hypothetical protein TREMPRED_000787, partial [Tremellales sp. Tagirdzhanova-0007]
PLEPGSLRVFYVQREEDPDVLAGYTRALIRGWITETTTDFLFRITTHHLAALFWESREEGRDSPRVSLMVALFGSASDAVLRRLLELDLDRPGELYDVDQEKKRRRLDTVAKLAGARASQRTESL